MRFGARTLRGKLTLAYASALLVALVVFAAASLALVDRMQRTALDDRLQTAANAIRAIVDVHTGRAVLDVNDRAQFAQILGTRLDGAVVDARGVVATTVSDGAPAPIRALARGPGGVRLASVAVGRDAVRVAVLPLGTAAAPRGAVVVWRDLEAVSDVDGALALAYGFAIPIFAAFALFAGGGVAARGLRPLDALATVASEIEAHDLSRRIAVPAVDDELGRLTTTFDRMLVRLGDAFERQRRFTSDASHELRAPLAVIRAEADLLLRRPRDAAEYERGLRAIARHADELEALTGDLLAAARLESGHAAGEATEVDLTAVAAAAAERLLPLARERRVALDVRGPQAPVFADEAALRRAILAVLHNALRYARADGSVTVTVSRSDATHALTVADDGRGFSDDALRHATERFWRDEHVRSRGEPGATAGSGGLGLSIAAATAAAAGGSLALSNRPQGGAQVTFTLPSFRVGTLSASEVSDR